MELTNFFTEFEVDEKKELEGVEKSLGKGMFITVARADNENFNRRILEESDLHLAEIKALPEKEGKELDKKIMHKVLAETVFLGFRGFADKKGKELKYSVETATMMLGHKEFFKRVMNEAVKFENFRVALEKADVKN